MRRIPEALALASTITLLALAACGGGSGGSTASTSAPAVSGASAGAMSSGTVTAFGSIFVNGHEFATGSAAVIDDDSGSTTTASALEVGMSVDVKAAANSTAQAPVAGEIHLHPLVRGIVDGSDSTAGTLTVMGQTVQLSASTNFADHRACLTATTAPCTAITGQSGLAVTSGAGSAAVAGSYVTVHGFLYSGTASTAVPNVVATLVSVADQPTGTAPLAYKAEGVVGTVGSGTLTIGGLAVDVSAATCYVASAATACASAFSSGQIVSAVGATAPALPATTFSAGIARVRTKLVVETDGASVEIEGRVSAVTASPAAFVVRGISVDASALSSGTLPAVGDIVSVAGTVANGGTSIVGSTVKVLHAARSATFGFEGDAAGVSAGSAAGTFTLTVLGQTITVDANTRLSDRSVPGSGGPSTANPFNITTFQTYLAASASQHLLVRTQADGNGNLGALSVTIVPASTSAAVGGTIDASPAPVNGSSSAPTTFSVHGLAVSADLAAVIDAVSSHADHGFGGMTTTASGTVAAGDLVLVRGTYAAGTLTVTAASGSGQGSTAPKNVVYDFGVAKDKGHDGL